MVSTLCYKHLLMLDPLSIIIKEHTQLCVMPITGYFVIVINTTI